MTVPSTRYCNCRPEGQRVELIRESYYDPNRDQIIFKHLCCACGTTEEFANDTTK